MNSKALKITAGVLAAACVISCAVFFVSRGGKEVVPENPMPVVYSYEQSVYTQSPSLSVKGANGEIFMPCDIGGVYYTASLGGDVAFFEYSGGAMVPCSLEKKQIKTNIKASYESIPVTVNYIEKDGKVFGCGVFTSDMDSSVDVYSYAFVKLTNKPSGYGNGTLLLADFDKDNFCNPNKLYSEIYNFNLSNGSASTYVSNNTRLIDKNGSFRQDWTLLTDDFIANLGGAKYFLSSRYYNESDKGRRADVMVLSNAYRPKIVVSDILGSSAGEKTLTEFEGDYFADYLQCGKYLINKKSLVLTDLMTGATKTLKDIDISSADFFSISPDGGRLVFASNGEANANGAPVQTLVYCTADGSAAPAVYKEPMLFSESGGFVWLDNATVMSVRALSGSGSPAGSVAYAF